MDWSGNLAILPQLLVNSLITGSIYALASSGLSLTYGLLRILNFAHGHFMMVGVYIFFLFTTIFGCSVPVACLATLLATILYAILSMRVFILPFISYHPILALVSTLALGSILEAAISMVFGVEVKALQVGSAGESIEFGSAFITPIQLVVIGTALTVLILLAIIVHRSSLGRKIRALAEHPHAAESLGVSQLKVSYGIFIVGTVLAALAGILVGYETNIQPTMGNAYTMKAFAAMILGGLGNIWGTVLGAYLLGLLENLALGLDFGPFSLPAGYKDAFAYGIILIVLLIKPTGLFSKWRRAI